MVIDPIIRFNWIFYAIYTEDLQHSTIVSFVVGLTEVCRRGMWMIFRVENEHCTNVGRFRASRDAPLPYEIDSSSTTTLASDPPSGPAQPVKQGPHIGFPEPAEHVHEPAPRPSPAQASGVDLERVSSHPITAAESLRRRTAPAARGSPMARALSRVGTLLHTAHAQDFERKRRPEDALIDEDEDEEGDSDSEAERPSSSPSRMQQRSRSQGAPAQEGGPDISDVERGPSDESEDEDREMAENDANRDDTQRAEGALLAAGRLR